MYVVHENSIYTGKVNKYWVFPLTEREAAVALYLELCQGYIDTMPPEELVDKDSPDTTGDYDEYHVEDGVTLRFTLAEGAGSCRRM